MFKVNRMQETNDRVGWSGGSDHLTRIAAGMCYQASAAEAVKTLVNPKTLWKSGHHTTFQHDKHYVTFCLENIPVSLVTFGLHLIHPFYNSSQRSGRYCTAMFDDDPEGYIVNFINTYYHETSPGTVLTIVDWVLSGIHFFKEHMGEVVELAEKAIRLERPNYPGDITKQAERIAQEQMRNFISTIVPTGMLHTLNITALASLYKAAWNAPLKALLGQMCSQVFDEEFLTENEMTEWEPNFAILDSPRLITGKVTSTPDVLGKRFPNTNSINGRIKRLIRFDDDQVNTLPFSPLTKSEYSMPKCKSKIELSVASFGQEQRHRTIRRDLPEVTGNFYLPPLLRDHAPSVKFALKYMTEYNLMVRDFSPKLMTHFIPYGSTVEYYREAEMNAWIHSAKKRLCWNAQEEISKLEILSMKEFFKNTDMHFGPPCTTGTCPEGKRYCGRPLDVKTKRKLI